MDKQALIEGSYLTNIIVFICILLLNKLWNCKKYYSFLITPKKRNEESTQLGFLISMLIN